MGQLDQQIVRIHNGIFALHGKEPFRIDRNVLVKGLVRKDQIVDTFFPVSPGPPGLLPEGSPGSRIAGKHRGIQLPNVDTQLQRIGRDQSGQLPFQHLPLDFLSFQRRISAPIARNPAASFVPQKYSHIQLVPGFL